MSSGPPLQDLFNMAGMNLPEYLKGKEAKAEEQPAAEVKEPKKK
jgi:flotillin